MNCKAIVLNNLLMDLVFTTLFSLGGQYFGMGRIDLATLPGSFAVGFVVGFCVVTFIPCVPLGMKISDALHLDPRGFGSYAVVSLTISVILTIIATYTMTLFGVCLMGGAPVEVGLGVATRLVGPFTVAAFIVALVIGKPIRSLALRAFPDAGAAGAQSGAH